MLFSDIDLASWVEAHFEPVWTSVRAVPRLTLDSGVGPRVVTTLHGNIATWITFPDGTVADVVAGLYDATTWQGRLEGAAALVARLGGLTPEARGAALRAWHARAATPAEAVAAVLDVGKKALEIPTEGLVLGHASLGAYLGPTPGDPAEDARRNEQQRRPRIHALLALHSPLRVDDAVTRAFYRDILDTDLDDPWLGLRDARGQPPSPPTPAAAGGPGEPQGPGRAR